MVTRHIIQRARPEILALEPYSSAHMEGGASGLRFNANEMPWSGPGQCPGQLNRYPVPQPAALLKRVAGLYQCESDQVLLSRGSDEAIDLIVRSFCIAGEDEVIIIPPTFGMYQVAANIQNAKVVPAGAYDRASHQTDLEGLNTCISARTKVVFLCSPNNPTGHSLDQKQVLDLCQLLDGKALVVLDEAYIDFAKASRSMISAIAEQQNLAVLRTFSKAYALAGLRCGALIANPDVIALLRKVLPPYPLPQPVAELLHKALEDTALQETRARVEEILRERERLHEALAALPFVLRVYPSDTNFLLLQVRNARAVMAHCHAKGIILRDQSSQPGLENHLRITVSSASENKTLLDCLGEFEI